MINNSQQSTKGDIDYSVLVIIQSCPHLSSVYITWNKNMFLNV